MFQSYTHCSSDISFMREKLFKAQTYKKPYSHYKQPGPVSKPYDIGMRKGLKKTADVNEARHLKFCWNKGKIPEPQQFPPTSDELYLHCQRVSYCTAIAKAALESNPAIPSPNGYGWKINNENALEVTWMTQKPAPESIQKNEEIGNDSMERANLEAEEENEEEDQESLGTDSEDENASDVENE
eukprot:gene14515-16021_t